MRRLLIGLALLALAVAPLAVQADMGSPGVKTLYSSSVAVDTAPAFIAYFIGDDTTAAVTADFADNSLTFLQGGGADTTVECPTTAAPFDGIVDTTNADCETWIELVNAVNTFDGSEWRVIPLAVLKADDTDNLQLDQGATEARGGGAMFFHDDSAVLDHRVFLSIPGKNPTDLVATDFDPQRDGNLQSPYKGSTQVLKYAYYNITSGGTMTDLTVTCVVPKFTNNVWSQTESVLYKEADATTGVAGFVDEFNYSNGGLRCRDGYIMVHLPTDTNLTVPLVYLTGYSEKNDY